MLVSAVLPWQPALSSFHLLTGDSKSRSPCGCERPSLLGVNSSILTKDMSSNRSPLSLSSANPFPPKLGVCSSLSGPLPAIDCCRHSWANFFLPSTGVRQFVSVLTLSPIEAGLTGDKTGDGDEAVAIVTGLFWILSLEEGLRGEVPEVTEVATEGDEDLGVTP